MHLPAHVLFRTPSETCAHKGRRAHARSHPLRNPPQHGFWSAPGRRPGAPSSPASRQPPPRAACTVRATPGRPSDARQRRGVTFQPLLRVVSSMATSSPTVILIALHSWHAPAKPNKWDGATLQPLLRLTTSATDSSPRSGMAQATPGTHPSRARRAWRDSVTPAAVPWSWGAPAAEAKSMQRLGSAATGWSLSQLAPSGHLSSAASWLGGTLAGLLGGVCRTVEVEPLPTTSSSW